MKKTFSAVCLLLLSVSSHAQIRDFQGIDFHPADSVARSYEGHSLANLKLLSDKLTSPLSSDVEKFRAIYTWVCLNIDNDPTLYFRNRKQREKNLSDSKALKEWNKKFHTEAVNNLIHKKKTVCTGYAYLVKELSYHAGIECMIVDGYGRTIASVTPSDLPNHSWNAVELNSKWYLCDPTWSSGVIDKTSMSFIRHFDTAYFLPEPSLFIRNHYPVDTTWVLMKSKPSKKEFIDGPLIYIGAYHNNIQLQTPSTFKVMATKGKKQTFQFTSTSSADIKKVSLVIENSPASDKVIRENTDSDTTLFSIDHAFKTRGNYDVHLYVNENPVATYIVSVR